VLNSNSPNRNSQFQSFSKTSTENTTFLSYLGRNKFKTALFTAVLWGPVALGSIVLHHPSYNSHASVIIKDSALNEAYLSSSSKEMTSSKSSNSVYNTMALLKSQYISDGLWNYLNTNRQDVLKKKDIKTQQDWNDFFKDGSAFIKFKNQPGTDIIDVNMSWDEPTVARELLGQTVEIFQNSTRAINQTEEREKRRHLNQQIDDVRHNLAGIREKIRQYKQEHQVFNISTETEEYAKSNVELETAIKNANVEAQAQNAKVSKYQALLGMSADQAVDATALGRNTTLNDLQNKLYELTQTSEKLRVRYTPDNITVRETDRQIESLKNNIKSEIEKTVSARGASTGKTLVKDETRGRLVEELLLANAEAKRLQVKSNVLQQYAQEFNDKSKLLPQVEETLLNLQDQEDALSGTLKILQQKEIDSRIQETQTSSNVFLVDHPTLPSQESFPTVKALVFLSLLISGSTAVALMYLLYAKTQNANKLINIQKELNHAFEINETTQKITTGS
jgi:uncharacterized protein involved in exopolysaccharide biosynthesis